MYLTQSILRKTADQQAVETAVGQFKAKQATGHMDPVARKLYAQKVRLLNRQDLAPQQRANLLRDVRAYERQQKLRQQHNLTDAQLNQQFQLKQRVMDAGARAMLAARQAGKPEEEAARAAQAAEQAVVQHIKGSGVLDSLFRGGDRADALARFGKYMQQTPTATATALDPKVQQQLIKTDPRYAAGQRAQQTGKWADRAASVATMGFTGTHAPNYFTDMARNRVTHETNAATQDTKAQKDKQYAAQVQKAPEMYRQGRRDQVTGFLKKNWMPIAGFGMGALGLMALMRGKPAAQAPVQQQQQLGFNQPGVDDWAQNKYQRGYQSAGTQQETLLGASPNNPFSSVFRNYMGGSR